MSEDSEVVERLRSLLPAEVSFNYLGQLDQALPETAPFGPAPEFSGAARSRRGRRQHLLEINGSVGGGRLHLTWMYSDQVHRRETIERLAHGYVEALRSIIAHCQSPEAGGYTPSDFPEAELSQKDLDKFLARIGQSSRG
jgi:non-ribosomal peptide synthase protein (TIGR01720 family)